MKGFNFNALFAVVFLFIAGCSSQMQRSNAPDSEVGTTWGNDVHSAVTGVSLITRRHISLVMTRFTAFVLATWSMRFVMQISDLFLLPGTTIILWVNGNILSRQKWA